MRRIAYERLYTVRYVMTADYSNSSVAGPGKESDLQLQELIGGITQHNGANEF